MLGVLPQDFDPIEFRTVGRQIVQIQAMLCSLAPLLVYWTALVYTGVVDQNDSWNVARLVCYSVKKCDHIVTCRQSLLSSPSQTAVVAQGTKHVHALSMRERFNCSGLADLTPAVLYWRVWAKARFVEI